MTQYLKIDPASRAVLMGWGSIDPQPFTGPAVPAPDDGSIWLAWQERINFSGGPTPDAVLTWLDGAAAPTWHDPRPLDQARADKAVELSTACGLHIVGGFISDALGAAHTYPSTVLDQHNLNGLVTRSLYPSNPPSWTEKFWCADAAGVWERRAHTAAQLQAVGDTAIARITAAQAQCDTLVAAAMAASLAGLDDITWTAP